MKVSWMRIQGFRNFENEIINFADKTLIIGANDVGKTNMAYALRILFDKSLSDRDLELNNSDYNAYTKANNIKITVCIDNITEDCLKSIFGGDIEKESVIIQYEKTKEGEYIISTGPTEELLEPRGNRFYLKRLNLEYVNSNRDLFSFMKRIKIQLLEKSKDLLKEELKENDKKSIATIQTNLDTMNNDIDNLNYIKNSLSSVNQELGKLSIHNEGQVVKFVTDNNDIGDLLDNLELSYSTKDSSLKIGGDGRNNQIFLATWIAKQKIEKTLERVTIFAIEEPEAHLHPHQQRKLSRYLAEIFDEQIFITTHSPQIASEFKPDKIVRLYYQNRLTKIAQGGCSKNLALQFNDFGYRINAISSETFFSDAVFLVEGPSEKLFYTALAKKINLDFDRYNITLLSVDGVGFKPYIKICNALEIPFVMRTDDDVFTKTKKGVDYCYCAGISRVMGIYNEVISTTKRDGLRAYWKINKLKNEWLSTDDHWSKETEALNSYIREKVNKYNIYLSQDDLENDLVNTSLFKSLSEFYGTKNKSELVKCMQSKKAENMLEYLEYLNDNQLDLNLSENDEIVAPINRLKEIVERRVEEQNEKQDSPK